MEARQRQGTLIANLNVRTRLKRWMQDQSGQSKKEFASSAGLVLWDETHTFTCAMEMDPKSKKFEEKHISFTVLVRLTVLTGML